MYSLNQTGALPARMIDSYSLSDSSLPTAFFTFLWQNVRVCYPNLTNLFGGQHQHFAELRQLSRIVSDLTGIVISTYSKDIQFLYQSTGIAIA